MNAETDLDKVLLQHDLKIENLKMFSSLMSNRLADLKEDVKKLRAEVEDLEKLNTTLDHMSDDIAILKGAINRLNDRR